jgi:CO/xanthine dehydrogenase Mo-binding subunit
VVLRSPHAHARIVALDAAAARAMPGVRLVLTGAELRQAGFGTLPCPPGAPMVSPLVVPPRHALALDTVRHVGEPLALVLAASPMQARDAAEAIAVEYPGPARGGGTLRRARPRRAAALARGAGRHLAYAFEKGDRAAVAAAFATAAQVVDLDLANQRVHAAPLEPRGCRLARYADGAWDLQCSSQALHGIRRQLAGVLGVDEARIGGCTRRCRWWLRTEELPLPEYVLALWAAREAGAPVLWLAEPGEEMRRRGAWPRAVRHRPAGAGCRGPRPGAGRRDGERPRRLCLGAWPGLPSAGDADGDGRHLRHSQHPAAGAPAPTPIPRRSMPIAAPASRKPTTWWNGCWTPPPASAARTRWRCAGATPSPPFPTPPRWAA